MYFEVTITALLGALLIEAAVGYPAFLFRVIAHPVVWMGALINTLDGLWNKSTMSPQARRLGGVLTLLLLILIAGGVAAAIQVTLVLHLPWYASGLILALPCAALLAQRSLHQHVAEVAGTLEESGLFAGRAAVSKIVGRNAENLDEAAVARASVESLSENFSDGIVTPALWTVLLGLPGIAIYKAINTADSMIGHRTDRHRAFGWASARLDDLVNLPGSRLSALWLWGAAAVMPGARPGRAVAAVFRDAGSHRSPNAGWPEAAMAGALGFRLGGPRAYDGQDVDEVWMGDGRADLTPADIRTALRLYRVACGLQFIVYAGLLALIAPWR